MDTCEIDTAVDMENMRNQQTVTLFLTPVPIGTSYVLIAY